SVRYRSRLSSAARRDTRRPLRHEAVDALALPVKIREHLAVERTTARELDAHRINEAAVDENLVMHMGAGRWAGGSNEADDLPLAHARALLHTARERGHVAI